jgi:hypothetical protein
VALAEVVNRPDVRRAAIPGGGIMSARAIARHYAMLAGDDPTKTAAYLVAEAIRTQLDRDR